MLRILGNLKSPFGRDRESVANKRRSRILHPALDDLESRNLLSTVTVPGKANIYGAGVAVPPAPAGGGHGVLPIEIDLSSLGNPMILDFPTVTGMVTAGGGRFNGPDGGTFFGGVTNLRAVGGISGIHDANATMFLVGVFLDPNGQPATPPAKPDVSNANSTASFSPLLGQQFFIGNGQTSAGAIQTFNAPAGATRLFLGFADGFEFGQTDKRPGAYGDDGGSLSVDVEPFGNLTAYRPYEADDSGINQFNYSMSYMDKVTKGVGIRIDGQDNGGQSSAGQPDPDLLRVDATVANTAPVGFHYAFNAVDPNINVWGDQTKTVAILTSSNPGTFSFSTPSRTFWVEWVGAKQGTDVLSLLLVNNATGAATTIDKISWLMSARW